jgi:hypothetical protein
MRTIRIIFPPGQRQHLLALAWQYPMRRLLRSRTAVRQALAIALMFAPVNRVV